MKILFLSRLFPYPAVNGAKLRVYNLLRGLADRHDVTLVAFNDQPDNEPDVQGLNPLCSRVEYLPWQQYDLVSLRSRLGLIVPMPRFLWDTYSSRMSKKISDVIQEQEFNLVMASSLVMASYRRYYRDLSRPYLKRLNWVLFLTKSIARISLDATVVWFPGFLYRTRYLLPRIHANFREIFNQFA